MIIGQFFNRYITSVFMLDTVKIHYELFSKFNSYDTHGDSHSSTQQNSGTPVGENRYLRLILCIEQLESNYYSSSCV